MFCDILISSSTTHLRSTSSSNPLTSPSSDRCLRKRCNTYSYIANKYVVQEPNRKSAIRDTFTLFCVILSMLLNITDGNPTHCS